jgi:DNA-binding transcriptional regulator YiaG
MWYYLKHPHLRILQSPNEATHMLNNNHLQQLEECIQLVRKGDYISLTELRNKLMKTRKEIADKIGVSEYRLKCWELGEEKPSGTLHSFWKIKLSDCIDEEISIRIRTKNPELITNFWEILWRLND